MAASIATATPAPASSSTLTAPTKTTASRRARASKLCGTETQVRASDAPAPRATDATRELRFTLEAAHIEARRTGAAPAGQSLRDFALQAIGEAPKRPEQPFGRRRGDLERVLAQRDPGALAAARFAFEESRRLGLVDARLLFEEWIMDAVAERARAVALPLVFGRTAPRPEYEQDAAGLVRSRYFAVEV